MGRRKSGGKPKEKRDVSKTKEKDTANFHNNVSNMGTKHRRSRHISENEDKDTITFVVVNENGQREIRAPKSIFDNVKEENLSDDKSNEETHQEKIIIEDMSERDVQLFISYARGNQVKIQNMKQAWNMIKLSERFQFSALIEQFMFYIVDHTDVDNVFDTYKKALNAQNEYLILKSLYFILREAGDVLKGNRIRGLPSSTLQLILSQEKINIESEVQLYDAAHYWVNTELKDKDHSTSSDIRAKMMPFLQKIRFLTMTEIQFKEGPASSDFLTEEQKSKIIEMISNEKVRNIPVGSYKREKRKPFPEKEGEIHISEDTFINYCEHKEQSTFTTIRSTFRSKGQCIFITCVLLRDNRKFGELTVKVDDDIRCKKVVNNFLGIIDLVPPVFIRREETFEFIFTGIDNDCLYSCENMVNFEKAPFCPVSVNNESSHCMPMHCFFWSILYFIP